uniref:Uncharacterized protein n=1 Tax=Globodera rostochiensis TaxID=31243 RepID=A0A914GT15_GLORO
MRRASTTRPACPCMKPDTACAISCCRARSALYAALWCRPPNLTVRPSPTRRTAEMLFFDESIGHEGSDDLVVKGHAKKIVAKRHLGRLLRSQQRREVAELLAEAERACQTLLRYRKRALQKISLELFAKKTLKYRDMKRILKKGPASSGRRRRRGENSRSSSVESNDRFDDIEGGVKYTFGCAPLSEVQEIGRRRESPIERAQSVEKLRTLTFRGPNATFPFVPGRWSRQKCVNRIGAVRSYKILFLDDVLFPWT